MSFLPTLAPLLISCTLLLASVIVLVRGRALGRAIVFRTAFPAAYLALHGCMGIVLAVGRNLALPHHQVSTVLLILDIAGILLLALTLVDADHAARSIRRELQMSGDAAREYARARADYDALLRHRIANPLAVVDGGIETLLALEEMSPPIRRELLLAMRHASRRLRTTTANPSPVGPEEFVLAATPTISTPSDFRCISFGVANDSSS